MVKRSYSRTLYIIGVIGCFAFLFFSLKEAWDFQQSLMSSCLEFCSHTERFRNEDVAMSFLFLFIALALIFGLHSAERRDQRRQLAAQNIFGNGQLTIIPASLGSVELPLPIVIRTRVTRRSIIQLIVFAWGITSVCLVPTSILIIRDPTLHSFAYLLLVIVSISLYLFMTAIMVFVAIIVREKIKISEDGMTIHSEGRTHSVYWRDAKLFARPPLTSDEKKQPQFELASANSRVVWNFIPEQHGFLAGPQPTMPYAEYARIMEALPALITAKTGLSLYDLRAK